MLKRIMCVRKPGIEGLMRSFIVSHSGGPGLMDTGSVPIWMPEVKRWSNQNKAGKSGGTGVLTVHSEKSQKTPALSSRIFLAEYGSAHHWSSHWEWVEWVRSPWVLGHPGLYNETVSKKKFFLLKSVVVGKRKTKNKTVETKRKDRFTIAVTERQ